MLSLLCLFDEAGFDGLNANVHPLYLTGWQANFDALQIGAKLAFRSLGNVRTDTATLLGLTLTVDDAAGCRTLACYCANLGHDGKLVKSEKRKEGSTSLASIISTILALKRSFR